MGDDRDKYPEIQSPLTATFKMAEGLEGIRTMKQESGILKPIKINLSKFSTQNSNQNIRREVLRASNLDQKRLIKPQASFESSGPLSPVCNERRMEPQYKNLKQVDELASSRNEETIIESNTLLLNTSKSPAPSVTERSKKSTNAYAIAMNSLGSGVSKCDSPRGNPE